MMAASVRPTGRIAVLLGVLVLVLAIVVFGVVEVILFVIVLQGEKP
jgi:hypothetical protein